MANCVLVGLGNMGWRYDAASDGVLTHAKAIEEHPNLTLVAAVDTNQQAREAFAQRYVNVAVFSDLAAAAEHHRFDWIILAVPTPLHPAAFYEALELKPKVIICEKPIAPSLLEAREMLARAKAAGVMVFINYIRPHEPQCKAMFNFIREAHWGSVEKIMVRYGKGIANNASHFIQLLVLAFGAPEKVQLLSAYTTCLADPDADFVLRFESLSVYFLRFDYQHYALSEMDIYMQQGAIFYRAMGQSIEYQQAQPDALFPSVRRLQTVRTEATQLSYYQRHALAYYYHVWQSQSDDGLLTQSALESLNIVEQLQAQIQSTSTP